MLLMMNLESTVWVVAGIEDRSGAHDVRWAMHKICVALNKEKGIRNILPHVHKNCLDNCSIK